jgi:hypothetical protein
MRKEFLYKEFQAIANLDVDHDHDDMAEIVTRDHITAAEFRQRYGHRVIERSEKVKGIIKGVEEEVAQGVSNGNICFDDFSYMYMFLEFNDKKEKKKAKKRASKK